MMQVRARTLQPYGRLVHDVFAPEDSPWRAAAEFWLRALAGDRYFTDGGNEDDWLCFCADVEAQKQPTDNFAIVEDALRFYAGARILDSDDGKKAREALLALERLADDWAERSANAVQEARDIFAMRKGWD